MWFWLNTSGHGQTIAHPASRRGLPFLSRRSLPGGVGGSWSAVPNPPSSEISIPEIQNLHQEPADSGLGFRGSDIAPSEGVRTSDFGNFSHSPLAFVPQYCILLSSAFLGFVTVSPNIALVPFSPQGGADRRMGSDTGWPSAGWSSPGPDNATNRDLACEPRSPDQWTRYQLRNCTISASELPKEMVKFGSP